MGKSDQSPGPVAYHTSNVYKESMFLFGGNNYSKTVHESNDPDNQDKVYTPLFTLNMKSFAWYMIKGKGDNVKPRDEHSAVIDEGSNSLVIFGGFEDGERTNEVMYFHLK